MRIPRTALLVLVISVLTVVIAACSSNAPATLQDIPVYAGAQPAEAGSNFVTDAMVKAIEDSVAGQNLTSQINLYELPEGTQWTDVKQFYTDQVGDDWKASSDLTQEADVINIIGWQRGSGASEQALIVGQAEDPLSGKVFLLTGLFTE